MLARVVAHCEPEQPPDKGGGDRNDQERFATGESIGDPVDVPVDRQDGVGRELHESCTGEEGGCRQGDGADRAGVGVQLHGCLEPLHFGNDLGEDALGIAEEHRGLIEVEELVLNAGEASRHTALHHNDLLGILHVEDRHAVDR